MAFPRIRSPRPPVAEVRYWTLPAGQTSVSQIDSNQRPPLSEPQPYQVLARKYRPAHFRDLIGQEAMVQTLTNAFEHDRIAHAFILTGVRGVGKTTTARIIAKGLNCESGDKPTIDPCGECEASIAISEGRHVDVLEMDAASNTSVNDVREIIDSVRYRAASARYKVYIIDEVHMLSTSAFNALLKTLEEPPEHVKFIFATTEIRKVPVTVLSRCQRFDLRRIEPEVMMAHLAGIAEKENARLSEEALALITRAAEGSVRDALSLLDQAIAHGQDGEIDAAAVRNMLGLADRGRVIDLFEAIMGGKAKEALEELSLQYADGADPGVVLRDLAELTHWISVIKVSAEAAEDPTVSPSERARGLDLAGRLPMRVLTRAWQMLLKALEELALAPNAMMAAEMAVIRLTHVADLPPPGDLVRKLTDGGSAPARGAPAPTGGGSGGATALAVVPGNATVPEASHAPADAPQALMRFASITDAMAMIKPLDFKLHDEAEAFLRLVRYRPGLIEFNPAPGAPADLAGRLGQVLRSATGERWSVLVSDAPGQPTVAEDRRAAEADAKAEAQNHPMIAQALAIFPGATISQIKPLTPEPEPEILAAIPEDDDLLDDDDDYTDPFEEDL
ncbi:MAG: DNA polymerase III subunit gamma/tau [Pseudomonadota bacterium]